MKTPTWKPITVAIVLLCSVYLLVHFGFLTTETDTQDAPLVSKAIWQKKDVPNIDKNVFNRSIDGREIDQMLAEKYGQIRFSGVHKVDTKLTAEETVRYQECVKNAVRDRNLNGSKFWGKEDHIRRTHHTYLARKDSILMEVGGNNGSDASEFVNLYNPRYIILEPLEYLANFLKDKFRSNSRVTVVNLGLGARDEVVLVKVIGTAAGTSKFSGAGGDTPLYVTNATNFMLNLGVGLFDIDLLTLNCEGCEFETLEAVLSNNLIHHFKNIQWATHSTLKGISSPLQRYCKIQELLSRTHRPTYQYRFIWESWRRRDIP